ncbi:MAG: TIGR03087 family PEP-CTERM/XrtA system glycosyltransferase [Nitrospira sp.]|nr:TIGR03087 family PEP-CTERM/XrtA system glycosyltransferase [Nitrospira sp.]
MKHKKNVLFICHRVPYPPNKGDKIRSYNILKFLSERYNVYLAFMVDDKRDLDGLHNLEHFAKEYFYDVINPRWKKLVSITAFASSQPISVPYFYSRLLQNSIDKLLAKQTIDIVFCFSSPTAEYVFRSKHYHGNLRTAKWIMDLVDVDSYKWKQYSEVSNFPMNWIYSLEAKYLLNYEKRIASEFKQLVLATEAEKTLFGSYGLIDNVHAVGNGVDFNFFSPLYQTSIVTNTPVIIFTGVMDYRANIDGVKWFVDSIFPEIQNRIPEITFYIVGKQPSAEIRALASQKGIVVTGFVEDVRDYYAAADVCLVPLQIARGIQNKVLEAMAMGKAVVCTPQALEGISAIPGSDVLIEENENAFADSVIKLLLDKPYRLEMGKSARRCIEDHYSWETNLNKLETIINI